MNLSNLRSAVAFKSRMSTADATELARIDAWLNEAYEDIVLRTHCKVSHGTVQTTANEWRYDLPTAALDILELWVEDADGRRLEFERTDAEHLLRLRTALTVDDGGALRYFAVEGSNFLLVWPTPSSVVTINLLYVPRPTSMSATADTPSYVPAEHHKALEYYALWQAAQGNHEAISQMGEYYRSLYEGRDGNGGILDRIRTHRRRRGGRSLGPVRLYRPNNVSNPSVDRGRW